MNMFETAKAVYSDWGIDVDAAISQALQTPISIHCWLVDDVTGFEVHEGTVDSGGIMATGNYPGKARNIDEARADYKQVLALVPGTHRLNLHAIYADTHGKAVARDEQTVDHYQSWIDWSKSVGLKLDFNPTYFAHPMASSGFTLSSADKDVREFWIRHGRNSRQIAHEIGLRQGSPCVNNHWIPDGCKDHPADRWSPRKRLVESLNEVLKDELPECVDAVESKLFGLGSEDFVVGSYEFYNSYALTNKKLLCLDMGHFHPTESIADKVSSLLQFHDRLLLHTSRPMRWDSDHVVMFNDDLRAVFVEFARGKALNRAIVALDFFDASINRIAAYVIGIRATRKALLSALLDPSTELAKLESEGKLAQKLALIEEAKTLPFGAIWDELCTRADVPVGRTWISDVESYEQRVLTAR